MKNTMRAVDADLDNLDKLPYPMAMLPKLDGVRTLVRRGDDDWIRAYARTNKPHRNPYIQTLFARVEYLGFDGEGIVGNPTDPLVSYASSGGFSRQKDSPKEGKFVVVDATFHVFDMVDQSPTLTWEERYNLAAARVEAILAQNESAPICMVPYTIVNNADELLMAETEWLELGYEGFILRKLSGKYKNGTATAKEATYLRGKRFVEREMLVSRIVEGSINGNEAKINERGQTERSSHKENMLPNGMVGTIYGYDVINGVKDTVEKCVSPGKMTDEMAAYYWDNPQEIVGHHITYKFFPIGNKDMPRFPTYQRHRAVEDL
jgi:DNA ligase-1